MPQQKREQKRQRPFIKGKLRKAGGKEGTGSSELQEFGTTAADSRL